MLNAAANGPGSPLDMRSAMAQPEPGMALNPPVPQPQLMKQLPSGVLEMMGERSPVMSTMPPHWRSIFRREMIGKVSIRARSVSSIWWKLPLWVKLLNPSVPPPMTISPLSDWLM